MHRSKDILMRVVAQNLSPELTLVEKVFSCLYFILEIIFISFDNSSLEPTFEYFSSFHIAITQYSSCQTEY